MPVSLEESRRLIQDINDSPERHKHAMTALLKKYRRLGKWIKSNSTHLGAKLGVQTAYVMTVAARVLELSEYTLGDPDMRELQATAEQVMETCESLLPLDSGVADRLRAVPWLAEPGILVALVDDLFGKEQEEGEVAPEVLFQSFVLLWVAIEVIAMASTPPA